MIPELLPGRGCAQKGMHAFDVLDHLFLSVDAAPDDLVIRLAALFHDAGKPSAMAMGDDGIPTFYNHEKISAEIAADVLKRMKFPNDTIDRVAHLIRNHMFNYGESWTDSAVRRFIAKVGTEHIEDLFSLRSADAAATQGTAPDPRSLDSFRDRIASILQSDNAFSIRDLKVSGDDLADIGIPKGPVMGRILRELLETVLDDPEQNEKDRLLRIAAQLKSRYGND